MRDKDGALWIGNSISTVILTPFQARHATYIDGLPGQGNVTFQGINVTWQGDSNVTWQGV